MLSSTDNETGFKLEPLVRLGKDNTFSGAFEILEPSLVRGEDTRAKDLLSVVGGVFYWKMAFFQKLNAQDACFYQQVFVSLNPKILEGMMWSEFLPFAYQFEINVKLGMKDVAQLHGHRKTKFIACSLQLGMLGIKLWLDDVDETSYRLPFDIKLLFHGVQLDKYFVLRCLNDDNMALMKRTITRWGVNVVAKGIETNEMSVALKNIGIQLGQGAFWSSAH